MNKVTGTKTKFSHITDEQEEQMETVLTSRVSTTWDRAKQGFYYIDVTGKYGVYFTLWRFKPCLTGSPYVKEFMYITNLSIDAVEAAKKARVMCGDAPIEVDACGNYDGLQGKKRVFTFGKYRGQPFGDVYATNPSYFTFLNKLIQRNELKLNVENTEMVAYFTELFFETMAKTNRETETNFVGAVGDVLKDAKLTVTHVNRNDDYTTFKMTDAAGNRYLTYNLPQETVVGAVLEPTSCKILQHREIVGINYTKIGYFKFLKVR